jgi:hypothetical protein
MVVLLNSRDLSLGSYYYCNNLSLSFLFRFCAKRSL